MEEVKMCSDFVRIGFIDDKKSMANEMSVDNLCRENDDSLNLRTIEKCLLNRITSRFGLDTEFAGDYRTREKNVGVEISGKVQANFELSDGSLIILASKATAEKSNFSADAIVIAGKFDGTLTAQVVEILDTACISGEISCKVIDIHAGAKIKATIAVITEEKS